MRTDLKSQQGAMLIEGMTALLILCITISAMLMITGIVIRGRHKVQENYDTAFTLNTLRDSMVSRIRQLADTDSETIAAAAETAVSAYPDWRIGKTICEGHLCRIALIHDRQKTSDIFEVVVYVPSS